MRTLTPKFAMLKDFRSLVLSDWSAAFPNRPSTSRLVWYLITDPGAQACLALRLIQVLSRAGHARLAVLVRVGALKRFGSDFSPGYEIGQCIRMPHPIGIVVGSGVKMGDRVTIMQGVTIGEKYLHAAAAHVYPQIGSDVWLGANSSVLGDISIGDRVFVGAHSLVLGSVAEDKTVAGVPARTISDRKPNYGL